MLVKILSEENDSPIVISGNGEKLNIPKASEEDDVKIFLNSEWIIKCFIDIEDQMMYRVPLLPGEYGKDDIRVACVMFLRFIAFNSSEEKNDDDKYIIYEIEADTVNKILSFEVEILDDDSEIEFAIDSTNNIENLINYEQNRIIKVKE